MKITHALTIASALVFAAGCAHEEGQGGYESDTTVTPIYSSGRMSEYNPAKNGSSHRSGNGSPGTYGNYSSGTSGAYSGATTDNGTAHNTYSDAYAASGVGVAGGGSDNAMIGQVRESLARHPEIAVILPNIQISVNKGVVLLNGSAQSEQQKRQITSIVQKATGVVTVNNQLKITAGPNENGNAPGPQLNPTGNAASQRLYKNAGRSEGSSISRSSMQNTNNNVSNDALNPTSRPNSGNQIYQQSNPGETGQMQNNGRMQNTNNNIQNP